MLTQEEFIEYYETKNRLPKPSSYTGGKKLNDRQLITKYKEYVKKCNRMEERKQSIKEDEDSEYLSNHIKNQRFAKQEARKLDPEAQVFFSKLTSDELKTVNSMMRMGQDFSIIDPAHIFSVGSTPTMADEIDNILMLPRCVHSLVDTYLNPLSEKHEVINKEQRDSFWIRFIGVERWNRLLEMRKGF